MRTLWSVVIGIGSMLSVSAAQVSAPAFVKRVPADAGAKQSDEVLRFALFFTRHGVRTPTAKGESFNAFARAAWPTWESPPGYLTPHGYALMKLFGAYDRSLLSSQGLLAADGCKDAAFVSFYADSDQRTTQTGRALAEGMFPDCAPPVASLPEGTSDPLYSRSQAMMQDAGPVALAAVKARFGGNPDALTEAYRPQLAQLDTLLATCGGSESRGVPRRSIFTVPASVGPGAGDHLVDVKGPLPTASTMTENLLLAYVDGKPMGEVGGGCVDGAQVRSLINLHTAATDITQRTTTVAAAQASNGLDHLRRSIEQAATGRRVPGARSRPNDRVFFVVGHDTNLLNMASLLRLSWLTDGRRDDTAPGGALEFELWENTATKALKVRVFYTVQTLEQMRSAVPLTRDTPPERVQLFLPACSGADLSCTWKDFDASVSLATTASNIDKE